MRKQALTDIFNAHRICALKSDNDTMTSLTTPKALKRATNVSLSVAVLEDAKALGINVSQVCEASLRSYVRDEQARRWKEEHQEFIAAYNASVDNEGLPLDEWRGF